MCSIVITKTLRILFQVGKATYAAVGLIILYNVVKPKSKK